MSKDFAAKDAKRQAYREAVSRELATITLEPRRPGRPTKYTPELGRLVCERMLQAGNLARACRDHDDMPDRVTVYEWSYSYPEFGETLSRAREVLADRVADDLEQIADDDQLEPNDRRVKIDTRKWLLERWHPRRFNTQRIEVSGDPNNPLRVLHESVSLDALSTVHLDAIERFARDMLTASDAEVVEDQAK